MFGCWKITRNRNGPTVKSLFPCHILEKNTNLKGLCPWIAQDGEVFLDHVKKVDSFKYVITSKELQQGTLCAAKQPWILSKGMQPKKKERRK